MVSSPISQVLLIRRYDPFGGLQTETGVTRSAYGFAGEEQDPTSGQLFLRARTYDPGTGRSRSVQADPVPGIPSQPRTLQKYAYAFNNPATFTDPSGQMPPGVIGAPLMSIPGYTPSPFAGPSYAPVPETQGGPGYLPPSTGSDRSANTAAWSPFSDPYARQQSQGFRPRPCGPGGGILDTLFNIRDAGRAVIDGVNDFVRDPEAAFNRLADQGLAN